MKHVKVLLIIALFFTANTISAQSVTEKWSAIGTFHEVMAQTFHPAEEGDLAPIKARSEELMTKAAALTTSEIPTEYKTADIMGVTEKIKAKAANLHKLITNNAPNEVIVKHLVDLHDTFHKIVGLCSEGKK